jgi:hypothetical protein
MEFTDKWKTNGRTGRDKVAMSYRHQKNVYAMRVTVQIMGGPICPSCETPLDLSDPRGYDVDKVVPARDYVPGNICYLCRGCNEARSILQSVGKDWQNVAQYAALVSTASEYVSIPKLGKETEEAWKRITATRTEYPRSRFA